MLTFTYGALGRVTFKNPARALNVSYDYDNLGNLISAATAEQTVAFTYDDMGTAHQPDAGQRRQYRLQL